MLPCTISSGHVECVKWLLANRAKHDVKDVNGRTPGDIAEVCDSVVYVYCLCLSFIDLLFFMPFLNDLKNL